MSAHLVPLYTEKLFRPLHAELIALLRSLEPAAWNAATVAGTWRVRDVAAHLLDGDLRKIAVFRDDHAIPVDEPITSRETLARFVNGINASGVAYFARVSPRLLVDLLEVSGPLVAELVESLPPHAASRYPVSWAGESVSENWMDTGREYTERWHHQMQIRDAVGAAPTLLAREWMVPLLDIAMRALPVGYAHVPAPDGTSMAVNVVDDAHSTLGAWTLRRGADRWSLARGLPSDAAASAVLTADAAWRILFNALPDPSRHAGIRVTGDERLAAPLFGVRSVIL